MTVQFPIPAPDAPAEEWGRLAVSIPGFRWMPGMLSRCSTDTRRAVYRWLAGPSDDSHYGLVCIVQDKHGRPCRKVATLQPGLDDLPAPDDLATAGCLLALLGPNLTVYDFGSYADEPGENGMRFRAVVYGNSKGKPLHWPPIDCPTLGRAIIAAAAALGEWPGGAS